MHKAHRQVYGEQKSAWFSSTNYYSQVYGEQKGGRARGSERGSDTITPRIAATEQPAPAVKSRGNGLSRAWPRHGRSMGETGTKIRGVALAVQFIQPA